MLKRVLYLICIYLILLPNSTQAQEDVQLRIRLRYTDGTAVFGETVILERLPALRQAQGDTLRQAQDDACTTDTYGACTWSVTPGLYQVLFTRPLDDLSSLAVAEGGLTGFGLTVGDGDIAYHFTFHIDGRVYFDAAPDSAVPLPIIPEPEDLHEWPAPTPTITAESGRQADAIPSMVVTPTQGTITDRSWRPAVFILLGLALGGGLHLLRRHSRKTRPRNRQQKDKKPAHPDEKATTGPGGGGTTHA